MLKTDNGSTSSLTPGKIVAATALGVPFGALGGGILGSLGKALFSFFDAPLASTVGDFGTFAGIGAIAYPLKLLPSLLVNHLIDNSAFLARNPNVKAFVSETSSLLLSLAAVTAAAALLGTPLAATVISMMVIPAALYVLSTVCSVINACLSLNADEEDTSFYDLAPTC